MVLVEDAFGTSTVQGTTRRGGSSGAARRYRPSVLTRFKIALPRLIVIKQNIFYRTYR